MLHICYRFTNEGPHSSRQQPDSCHDCNQKQASGGTPPGVGASLNQNSKWKAWLRWLFLVVAVTNIACSSLLDKEFTPHARLSITIPNSSATEKDIADQQGTLHVCPSTSVQVSWQIDGKPSLSATSGERYQATQECLSVSEMPSSGTGLFPTCQDNTTVFRATASHTFWRRYGACPGYGCPNADHEVIVASSVTERMGGRTGDCVSDAYVVINKRPALDWDERYRVSTVSLAGPQVTSALEALPGRTLTVTHDGQDANFRAGIRMSDAFHGGGIAGSWELRLSGCDSPPPALTINVEADCSK
jgi:hypothetical protein